jgi:hypothetical protein
MNTCPLHGASFQPRNPGVVAQPARIDQPKFPHVAACLPRDIVAHGGAPVPGTDVLADVAAEHPRRQRVAPLFVHGAAHFNRQVGDAARGIYLVGGRNGACRAGVKTSRAGAALVHTWKIRFKVEVGDDLAEKHPRPQRWVDQARIFPDPAKAGRLSVHTLLHRAIIHTCEGFQSRSGIVRQPSEQRTKAFLDDEVIVVSPGVPGDRGVIGSGSVHGIRRLGVVDHRHGNDGPCGVQGVPDVGAFRR